jgi:hypothetical protein
MANPLLLDITLFLIANGVGTADGVDIFRDFEPEMPDNIIVLSEYNGSGSVSYDPTSLRSIQIKVRNIDADSARQKALIIYKLLYKDEDQRIDFTTDRWGQVSLRQSPFRIGSDKSNRVSYGFNCGITTTIE